MLKLKYFLAVLAMLTCGVQMSLQAQVPVVLIETSSDNKTAIFSVEATAAKGGDVPQVALHILFETLLDQGVEGFQNGRKLQQVARPKWRENFMKVKNPPYMTYVKGYQTEGEPIKNSVGKYQATVLVKVNVEFLVRQLKAYGILIE